jgi:hypothetical protein
MGWVLSREDKVTAYIDNRITDVKNGIEDRFLRKDNGSELKSDVKSIQKQLDNLREELNSRLGRIEDAIIGSGN